MNIAEARMFIRWALMNPDEAQKAGDLLWGRVGKMIPSMATTAGAYLLSEWLAKKFHVPEILRFPKPALPALEMPAFAPALVEKAAAGGERIEPPENWMSWQKDRAIEAGVEAIKEKSARATLKGTLARFAGR